MQEEGSNFRKRVVEDIYNYTKIAEGEEIEELKKQLDIAKQEIEDYKQTLIILSDHTDVRNLCNYCLHDDCNVVVPKCVCCYKDLPCKKWCKEVWLISETGYVCSEECKMSEKRSEMALKYNKKYGF
jgi:hypothetical protein